MMIFTTLAVVVAIGATFAQANTHEIRIVNNCNHPVWPGLLNNPGKALPENGGFKLDHGQHRSIHVPKGWAGRVWGRTDCNGAGHCVTGDCGNKIACHGAGGVPPVSLAEFTLDGWQGQDYYDVSLVDGYNLPISIEPIGDTYTRKTKGHYDCKKLAVMLT